MMENIERFKPGVPKAVLYFLAATVWGLAGVLLVFRGIAFTLETTALPVVWIAGATASGVLFYRLMFRRISSRHIERIASLSSPFPCMFAFLSWRGYLMMAGMIFLGIVLRSTGLVSASAVGVMYVGMGVPLVMSGVKFAFAGRADGPKRHQNPP